MKVSSDTKKSGRYAAVIIIWLGVSLSLGIVLALGYNMNRNVTLQSEKAFNRNLRYLAESTSKSMKLFFDGVVGDIFPLIQTDAVKKKDLKKVGLLFRILSRKYQNRLSHMIMMDEEGKVEVAVTKKGPSVVELGEPLWAFHREIMSQWRIKLSSRLIIAGDYIGVGLGVPIVQTTKVAKPPQKGGSAIYTSGAIMALVSVGDLVAALLNPVRVESSGFAWLVTSHGGVIGDSDRLEAMVSGLYGKADDAQKIFHADLITFLKGKKTFGWTWLDDTQRNIKIERNGDIWFLALANVRLLDQQWRVLMAAPRSEATALLQQSFRETLILMGLVVIILVGAGWVLTSANRRWARAEEKAIHMAELEEKNLSLRELNRRMDEFVSVASHDIRSPLSVIRGFVKIIQSDPEGKRFERETNSMLRSCNRLLQLVNDILDVAKLESGKVELAYDPVVVDDLLHESIMTMELIASDKKLRLTHDFGEPTPMEGDSTKLLQVFNNLIANAIKFTPEEGSIHIVKKVNDGRVRILFSDSGPGIPAEEVESVFDKFEQVKKSQAGVEPGIGLGLTICKSLVELHRGVISVSSGPNSGATFVVELPLKRPSSDQGPL